MSRAWTSGRPALIIVANWRVNTTTSRVLTPPPNLKLSLNSLGAARTCTTTMRFFRRCAMTSSRVGRSILSLTRSPLSVRAVYWKSGMAHSLRAPLAARRYLGSAGGGLAPGRYRLPVVERCLADHPQELVRRRGHPEAFVLGALAAHVQLVERIVQRLHPVLLARLHHGRDLLDLLVPNQGPHRGGHDEDLARSEEHTSELQSQSNLVCRLLLEKKKNRPGTRCLGSFHLLRRQFCHMTRGIRASGKPGLSEVLTYVGLSSLAFLRSMRSSTGLFC